MRDARRAEVFLETKQCMMTKRSNAEEGCPRLGAHLLQVANNKHDDASGRSSKTRVFENLVKSVPPRRYLLLALGKRLDQYATKDLVAR